ncbi:MAG: ankyrin repeat domain-containing protein [Spirochaetes bacterium]|nr:ankyrin repeat domain-containing protein [Spirochaetota bacterium]
MVKLRYLVICVFAASAALSLSGCGPAWTLNLRAEDPSRVKDANQLIRAIELGNDAKARQLIAKRHGLNDLGPADKTAVSVAARTGNFPLVKLLVQKGAKLDKTDLLCGSTGGWAMIWAVENGHPEIARYLGERGARIYGNSEDSSHILRSGKKDLYMLLVNYTKGFDYETSWFLARSYQRSGSFIGNAAARGWTDLVKTAMKRGASLKSTASRAGSYEKSDSYTPLMHAIMGGHTELARFLIDSGSKIDQESDKEEYTALMFAAAAGNEAIARILIKKKADVNHMSAASHLESIKTTTAGNRMTIETETQQYFTMTPLMLAAKNGRAGMVRLLLASGAKVDTKNNSDLTALSYARRMKHGDIAKTLLAAGAREDPLILAVRERNAGRIQALIAKGKSLGVRSPEDYGPLTLAVKNRSRDMADLLMKYEKKLDDEDKSYAFWLAADYGDADFMQKALAKKWSLSDDILSSALKWAVLDGSAARALLIINRAKPSSDVLGPALHQAARAGNMQMVRMLVEKGADVNYEYGYSTPVGTAAGKGKMDVVKYLISKKADPLYKSFFVESAMMKAAKGGHTEIVRLLISKGADVDEEDFYSRTPLSLAAEGGHAGTVELLLSKKADVDVRTGTDKYYQKYLTGETPLMLASGRGHAQVVKILLRYRANIHLTNWFEEDALVIAKNSKKNAVVGILKAAGAKY